MVVSFRFALILACFADLGFSAYSKENFPNIFEDRLLVINPAASPTLKYYCLKESFFIGSLFYTDPNDQPVDSIAQISLDSHSSFETSNLILSTISSSSISDWLLGQYLDSIEVNIPHSSFLLEESYKIAQFFEADRKKRFHKLALITQELRDRNLTEQTTISSPNKKLDVKSKNEEEGFGKFSLYLIIGGGICAIYSVMAPAGGSKKGDGKAEKIELARRKRWLEQIRAKGWIDQTTYHFLLKKIDDLPAWLGGIKPPDQSTGTETSVDLSKRKSGESVVITKDTSEDKTSR